MWQWFVLLKDQHSSCTLCGQCCICLDYVRAAVAEDGRAGGSDRKIKLCLLVKSTLKSAEEEGISTGMKEIMFEHEVLGWSLVEDRQWRRKVTNAGPRARFVGGQRATREVLAGSGLQAALARACLADAKRVIPDAFRSQAAGRTSAVSSGRSCYAGGQ